MKIRTQVTVAAALFGVVFAVVGISLFLTYQQVERLKKLTDIAHTLELGARELSYLSNDYLLHGEPQQRVRWEAKFSVFSDLLPQLSPDDPEYAVLIKEIGTSRQRLRTIFDDVVATLEHNTQAGADNTVDLHQIRVSWSRMEVQNQTIAFNGSQIVRMLEQRADRLRTRSVALLFALLGIFGAFLVSNYVTVNRRTLQALANLQQRAGIIGSGNLEPVFEETRADEIGDLFRAFSRMTEDLRMVTASKLDLEREIDERGKAEAALRQSEAKYRNLFENMTEEVHFWEVVRDERGEITTWRLVDANPPTLLTWGRKTVEEIRGMTTDEIFGRGATEHYLEIVRKIMTEGISYSFEDYFPHLDRYFRFTSVPLGDHFITTGADITDIKKAEERMRQALTRAEEGDRLLSALMEYVPEGITMVDADLRLTRISRYGRDLLGTVKEGGVTIDPVGHGRILQADGESPMAFDDLPLVRAVRSSAVIKGMEIVQVDEYGERLPVLCNAGPIRDAAGEVVGGILAWRDISEYKQVETAFKRSNQELEQFASVASHDLQEPLRAIVGFLQLLQSKYGDRLDDKGLHFIDRTVKAAHRMQALIRDLLHLSRVSTKGTTFTLTDLNQIVRTLLEDLQAIIREKGVDIRCSELPKLEVDVSQIRSLFQNLIVNGIKYNVSPNPTLEIDCVPSGRFCRFSIRDNGIGISPRFHQRIFVVFQRLHTESEYAGTGMGLALCKKIVERHGGTIWVESQPGQGATFFFTLPQGSPEPLRRLPLAGEQ